MRIYNTLSQKIEELLPINWPEIKMYVCGITPYDEMHVGHARCYVIFDVLRRVLRYKGYNIKFVQNFTDIDDKIIARSKELNVSTKEIAEKYINSYFESEKLLNITPADVYPKVTEHIDDIILAIEKLIKNGYAYITETGVYFDVSKFHNYGKLSKRNISELISGARVEPLYLKKSMLDFALWKMSKPEEDVRWDSPWGRGRPGWHIECSVMSMKYLGETLDIHGGGQDLIFPHHENEIAQSESLTGKKFVNYWVHNGFVTVNKEKMSKSLKNIFSLKDIFQEFDPMAIRIFLLSQHYRHPLDFSLVEVRQFVSVYNRFVTMKEDLEFLIGRLTTESLNVSIKEIDDIFTSFISSLENDLNFSSALSYIHKLINFINSVGIKDYKIVRQCYDKFMLMMEILGIKFPEKEVVPQEVLELVNLREERRKNKDFVSADNLRKKILSYGYIVEDTKLGPRVRKVR